MIQIDIYLIWSESKVESFRESFKLNISVGENPKGRWGSWARWAGSCCSRCICKNTSQVSGQISSQQFWFLMSRIMRVNKRRVWFGFIIILIIVFFYFFSSFTFWNCCCSLLSSWNWKSCWNISIIKIFFLPFQNLMYLRIF